MVLAAVVGPILRRIPPTPRRLRVSKILPLGRSILVPRAARPRRVQLAIDSFKGSVSSAQAEEAVAEGVCRVWPDAQVSALPLADGGEGTLDAVAACGR